MWTVLGIVGAISTGIFSNYLYTIISTSMANRRLRLDMDGTWGEFVPDSIGRRYSVGTIYFDRRRGFYCFDGTNFEDTGKKYCHWQTIMSYLDRDGAKFFYLFSAHMERGLDKTYYGFGVVNLERGSNGKLVPADGHYVSANIDGHPMSHTMQRLGGVEYCRAIDGKTAIAAIKTRY